MNTKQKLGKEGEKLALDFLKAKGLTFLAANFTTRFGELDLVMEDGKAVVFIEVKRRESDSFGEPQEAVTPLKRNHLARSALMFIKRNHLEGRPIRFDVVSITPAGVKHIPDAFLTEGIFYY